MHICIRDLSRDLSTLRIIQKRCFRVCWKKNVTPLNDAFSESNLKQHKSYYSPHLTSRRQEGISCHIESAFVTNMDVWRADIPRRKAVTNFFVNKLILDEGICVYTVCVCMQIGAIESWKFLTCKKFKGMKGI